MPKPFSIALAVSKIKKNDKNWPIPFAIRLSKSKKPFWVLLGAILSLRTRDFMAESAFNKLIRIGHNAKSLARLSESEIIKAIYPVAFFKQKARNLKVLSQTLVDRYNGKPPKEKIVMPFSMLLNIVGSSNAKSKDVLWKFINRFHKDIKSKDHPILDGLIEYAINYFNENTKPKLF